MKIIIALVSLVAVILIGSFFYFSNSSNKPLIEQAASLLPESANIEPPQFVELTIPYLRTRTYTSNLNAMNQVSQNSTYTTYLTSYQSDGFKINGLLTRPSGQMPEGGWPAIVFVHGYIPPNQYQTQGSAYSSYVDYLAKRGFVVFKIDLRGHGDSEGTPAGGYYSADYVIDTLNAYAALASSDFVNPSRIGLWGHSMAGNVTLRSFTAKQDIPAIVVWGGAGFTYQDLAEYRISDSSYRPQPSPSDTLSYRQRLRDLYGDPAGNNPFWKLVAPTNYLEGLKGAIQLHHAADDKTVNVEYSRNLNQILDKTSIPHEYYEYQSGGHDIEGASFTQAMQRTVDFYNRYLPANP